MRFSSFYFFGLYILVVVLEDLAVFLKTPQNIQSNIQNIRLMLIAVSSPRGHRSVHDRYMTELTELNIFSTSKEQFYKEAYSAWFKLLHNEEHPWPKTYLFGMTSLN